MHLPVEARTETLGRVLYNGNIVSVGDLHDAVDAVRHAVERHRHNRLGLASGFGDAVLDRLLKQLGIHIPRLPLGIHKHRRSAEVSHRMARGAERKRLHQHLIARSDSARNQRQMHRRRAGRESHNLLVKRRLAVTPVDKFFEIFFKSVYVRAKRHHPVLVKCLLYIIHFLAAHVSQAKQNTFAHIFRLFRCYISFCDRVQCKKSFRCL